MPKKAIVLNNGKKADVDSRLADVLVKTHKATYEEQKAPTYKTRALKAEAPKAVPSELDIARADYEKAFDKKPYYGWGVETLREKIAEAEKVEVPSEEVDEA